MEGLLKKIETAWLDKGFSAIISHVSTSDAPVYGCAFWMLYCDYSVLGVPCFAINDEDHESAQDQYQRWAPPEWRIDVHDVVGEMQELYSKLSNGMKGKSDEDWEEMMEAHYGIMCSVSLQLTEKYHQSDLSTKNSGFIVCILEEREGDEIFEALLKNSTSEARVESAKGLKKLLG